MDGLEAGTFAVDKECVRKVNIIFETKKNLLCFAFYVLNLFRFSDFPPEADQPQADDIKILSLYNKKGGQSPPFFVPYFSLLNA